MALIEIYIKNYSSGGSVVTTETLLQSVPFAPGSIPIIEPKVKGELGKAGSFEFKMEPNHPFYSSLLQMKTIMRVVYAGNVIFRGRVLTIDADMYGSKSIHCEGDFAFLLDTPQEGTKEDTRPSISVSEYLEQVVAAHNAKCGDTDKQFTLGEYPGHYSEGIATEQQIKPSDEQVYQQYGSSSWNTSMDRFEDILGIFGGYWRTRYVSSGGTTTVYLDWLNEYYRDTGATQTIEVAKNLIDMSETTEVDNLFTVVIPIGKRESEDIFITDYWPVVDPTHAAVNYIEVPELVNLYSLNELNFNHHKAFEYLQAISKFGRIYKVVTFDNANMEEKLFEYAKDWIKNNYMGQIISYDINALDMRNIDATESPLLVGDLVRLVHPNVSSSGDRLTVISAEYDLFNPEKTKYNIGMPNALLNATYGVKAKSGGGGGGGGGISDDPDPDDDDEEAHRAQDAAYFRQQYVLKTDYSYNIGLDDPLAFLVYDDTGYQLDESSAAAYLKSLTQTERREMVAFLRDPIVQNGDEATKWFVLNNNSAYSNLKAKQQAWSDAVTQYAIDAGLDQVEASVITSNRTTLLKLARLVDDAGSVVPPYNLSDEMRELAIRARRSLTLVGEGAAALKNSTKTSFMANAFNLLGTNFDLDEGLVSFDAITGSFDFNSLFENALGDFDLGKIFSIDTLSGTIKSFTANGAVQQWVSDTINNVTSLYNNNGVKIFESLGGTVNGVVQDVLTIFDGSGMKQIFIDGVNKLTELWTSTTDPTTGDVTSTEKLIGIDGVTKVIEFDNMSVIRKETTAGGGSVSFGFYDEGNLSGGVVVNKLNTQDAIDTFDPTISYPAGAYVRYNGQAFMFTTAHAAGDWIGTDAQTASGYTTKIVADRVDLGNYATVGQLQASYVTTEYLLAHYTATDDLSAAIGDILSINAIDATFENVSATSISVGGLTVNADFTMDGSSLGVHTISVGNTSLGYVLASNDINFNLADMDDYEAAISAAYAAEDQELLANKSLTATWVPATNVYSMTFSSLGLERSPGSNVFTTNEPLVPSEAFNAEDQKLKDNPTLSGVWVPETHVYSLTFQSEGLNGTTFIHNAPLVPSEAIEYGMSLSENDPASAYILEDQTLKQNASLTGTWVSGTQVYSLDFTSTGVPRTGGSNAFSHNAVLTPTEAIAYGRNSVTMQTVPVLYNLDVPEEGYMISFDIGYQMSNQATMQYVPKTINAYSVWANGYNVGWGNAAKSVSYSDGTLTLPHKTNIGATYTKSISHSYTASQFTIAGSIMYSDWEGTIGGVKLKYVRSKHTGPSLSL